MAGTNESTNTIEGSLRRVWRNAGVPTNGAAGTYVNVCAKGDLLIDTTNAKLYQNTNTSASPTWTERAASGATIGVVGDMAAAGTAAANSAGIETTAAAIDHVHALGAHDHSGATAGGDLGAVSGTSLTLTGYAAIGTNPAGAGAVRLANAAIIGWRNAANDGDISALAVNAADDIDVGADLQMQGNTVYGNDAEDGNLVLSSTLHATKGFVGIPTGEEGLKIGGTADRAGAVGDNALHIFNGAAAPAGTLANGVSFYSEAGEAKVLDAAGNSTTLSPHTADGDYVIHSFSNVKGETVTIHLEKLVKALVAKDASLAKFVEVGAGHVKKPKTVKGV